MKKKTLRIRKKTLHKRKKTLRKRKKTIGGGNILIDVTSADAEYNDRFIVKRVEKTEPLEDTLIITDTKYNNNYIYKYDSFMKMPYILFKDDTKYFIYIITADAPYMNPINMDPRPALKPPTKKFIEQNINLPENKQTFFKFNIKVVKLLKLINLARAQDKIMELNHLLQLKCNNLLSLKLDFFYNMTGEVSNFDTAPSDIILCLYYADNCIASISLKFKEDTLTLYSKTHERFEGNKFNKLLRAIVIMFGGLITYDSQPFKTIKSYAINPISAWLLISNYKVTFDEDFMSYMQDQSIDMEMIKSYMKDDNNITIYVDLDENQAKAEKIFSELLSTSMDDKEIKKQIKCPAAKKTSPPSKKTPSKTSPPSKKTSPKTSHPSKKKQSG